MRCHPYLVPRLELAEEIRKMEEDFHLANQLSPLALAVPVPFQETFEPWLLMCPWTANTLGLLL